MVAHGGAISSAVPEAPQRKPPSHVLRCFFRGQKGGTGLATGLAPQQRAPESLQLARVARRQFWIRRMNVPSGSARAGLNQTAITLRAA